jgi:hypothetical protein
MTPAYQAFLASKAVQAKPCGLDRVPELAAHLFPFQRHCVEFALHTGCSGLFLDTGLGKTECELEWCQQAIEATGDRALILTPLAVAQQTKRRMIATRGKALDRWKARMDRCVFSKLARKPMQSCMRWANMKS